MNDFSKEVTGYALRNAIEFGKADAGKILPKLFQHGLRKEEIKEIMPLIQEIVKKVNAWDAKTKEMQFGKFKEFIKEREEEKERELPELPNIKGKPIFRMAPFPSGAMHIGNAKTYLLNALYSEKYKGKILLIMDDTIGSSEKPAIKESYNLIKEGFNFLKVKYNKKIFYKSDRLKIYYKYAEELIRKKYAYVCHCVQEELRKNRERGKECSCRQFPVEVQLKRWKDMFKANEGDAVLRIKTDMKHPNPAFRDRVLFKISDREHPRVGKKYRVWPTLEMSWAVDDHLLKITHIIRGNDLTIETEMEKFIWDIFEWKHPETIHTGLVKIDFEGAKLSKSKAQKEVLSGEFSGWDDPRTWSIQSLERRGIRAEAIREFVEEIGLNRQDISVPIESLYAINRKMVDSDAERHFFVSNPMSIKIKGAPKWKSVGVPKHPEKEEIRNMKIGDELIISKDDFDKYKGNEVRLIHLYNISLGEESKVTGTENKNIQKIQWIYEPVKARVLMPDGKWTEGISESSISELKKGDVIQFERFGFARFDGVKDKVYEFWFAHR